MVVGAGEEGGGEVGGWQVGGGGWLLNRTGQHISLEFALGTSPFKAFCRSVEEIKIET